MPLNSPINDSDSGDTPGKLYVVATPIGNRGDITLRALDVLRKVDLIAAEDTRHTGRLLAHHNIKTALISYHNHNEKERTYNLLNKLLKGLSIALVSNAGTPSVSDPGYALVNAAIARRIMVIPIPGVSATTAALSVAGLPTDSFVFVGFLPKKKGMRNRLLKELANEPRTVIFYESPRRILTLISEIEEIMGNRYAVLCREMTKIHEEYIRGALSEIHYTLNQRSAIKGECTLLVTGYKKEKKTLSAAVQNELQAKLKTSENRLPDLVKALAEKYGISKNKIYNEALKIKERVGGDLPQKG